MTRIIENTTGKIRDLPIGERLRSLLLEAGTEAGIDEVRIFSGGQCAKGTCTKRTGGPRHDLGRAADMELWRGNRRLEFVVPSELPIFEAFVRAAARLGAMGMGAGPGYMGGKAAIHVGFGSQLVWGANGSSANAPDWLRNAAAKGWKDGNFAALIEPAGVEVAGQGDDCSEDAP
jgi:hypothetical protein